MQAGDADMVDTASLSCDNDKHFSINDVAKLVRLTKEESKLPYFHVMHTR